CFISPFKKDRQLVRELFSDDEFKEIYISTPIEVCETRDPKGLYKKARSGELKNFTGIDSKYEPPDNPDIVIDTSKLSIDEGISEICFKLGLVKK
ncbi:MAG: adenylyl-sulfate kinase, partial [Leptospiraceae bacterium]|nr:adenylyl-sulfate kinase [Leptospiraceae bacterium]